MNRASALSAAVAALCCGAGLAPAASGAALIGIVNLDQAGVGLNDPTVVQPIGGNPGTTLGEQRMFALRTAADVYGARLTSAVPIFIEASFSPLACTSTLAVLGSAGPLQVYADFPGAPQAGTWYVSALANKLRGSRIDATAHDMRGRFNVNLGTPGCFDGSPFYLGVDNAPPAGQVNLLVVLLHEFAHGFGFTTTTSPSTGIQFGGLPIVYDNFLVDNATGKNWVQMTNAERVSSAVNTGHLVWSGSNATVAANNVLAHGAPRLQVSSPSTLAGTYVVGPATFGPALQQVDLSRGMMPYVSNGALQTGCAPYAKDAARRAKNRIAILQRGTCPYTEQVKNAQVAGAAGAIIADNVAGSPPGDLVGTDATITIPAARLAREDALKLLSATTFDAVTEPKRNAEVTGRLFYDNSLLAGADATDRVFMFAPNPMQPGASVTHWDTSATPNLLLEPYLTPGLALSVSPPDDLTLPVLQDLGW